MAFDFTPYFDRYLELVRAADMVFDKISTEYPQCVTCKLACSDCCYALFDLSLIEALYINRMFYRHVAENLRETLTQRADVADRAVYKLKKQAHKDFSAGVPEAQIIAQMSQARIRCPLLNDANGCDMYGFRPITCRLYGIPTEIGGQAHTCGISAFEPGKAYRTVNIDRIQARLYQISSDMVKDMQSRYVKMAEMLVPLSMALLTDYDDVYLGIDQVSCSDQKQG